MNARSIARSLYCLVLVASLLPSLAYGQATLSGVVRDASGAVLPGVTVEASSPALIERARSAVTDGGGQYRIVDLRPGEYVLRFVLQGFTTIERDRVEVAGGGGITINTDMRGGAPQGTNFVTRPTPLGDAPTR